MKQVARAFVFNADGDILLARHEKEGKWILPGGHIEAHEGLHDGLLRELQEEFGIKARFLEIDDDECLHHQGKKLTHKSIPLAIYDLQYTNAEGKDKSRTEYIFLMETDDSVTTIQTEEIAEWTWMDPEKFLSLKPNRETWDFYIEILEKILSSGEED
jgi:ADP-ribose pyrophosphatase YjhB (NUDIX family)